MDDLNQVAIAGRLTRDPQLRTTRNGTTICSLRIACNKMFFNIKVWGDPGRELAASASKGDVVQVEGRLDWYEWSPGDGPRREYVGVVANDTPGSVQCIASAGGPSVGMSGEGSQGMGFPQMNGTQGIPDLASSIAAQSQRVDFGLGALAGADPSALGGFPPAPAVGGYAAQGNPGGIGLPVAPVTVDLPGAGLQSTQAMNPNGFPGVTPRQESPIANPQEFSISPSQGFPVAPAVQEPPVADTQEFSVSPSQGFPVSPAVQESPIASAREFSVSPSQGFPVSAPVQSVSTEILTAPQVNPTPAASSAPPMASQSGIGAPEFQGAPVQITAQALQATVTEPVVTRADVSAFAAFESQSSAVALADPDLALTELGHDPNEALAMDPENEVIDEDNRFL